MTTDDVTHLRTLLAEQTTRAERAEIERDAITCERNSVEDRLATALAACAEMREAAVGVDGRCRLCTARPREHRDNCALSRTDLGRGMVAVPREVLERAQTVVGWYVDNGRGLPHGTRIGEKLLCDLDALLDGGKEGT